MAESKDNIMTHGLSGTVGNLVVFRQRAGKTIVANLPKESKVPPTAEQLLTQMRFRESNIYARAAMKDPKVKEIYESKAKPGQSAFNVAMSDFFHPPVISDADVSGYTGKVGDVVKARVTDDVLVTGVFVSIVNEDGKPVEKGEAVVDSNGLDFTYTATADNPDIAGTVIEFSATDMPDNVTTLDVTIK